MLHCDNHSYNMWFYQPLETRTLCFWYNFAPIIFWRDEELNFDIPIGQQKYPIPLSCEFYETEILYHFGCPEVNGRARCTTAECLLRRSEDVF